MIDNAIWWKNWNWWLNENRWTHRIISIFPWLNNFHSHWKIQQSTIESSSCNMGFIYLIFSTLQGNLSEKISTPSPLQNSKNNESDIDLLNGLRLAPPQATIQDTHTIASYTHLRHWMRKYHPWYSLFSVTWFGNEKIRYSRFNVLDHIRSHLSQNTSKKSNHISPKILRKTSHYIEKTYISRH